MGAAGGSGKTGGGNFIFRGASHATLPGDFSMRSGLGVWLNWDESAGITTFLTGIGNPKTLAMTIDASQNFAFEGDVGVAGLLSADASIDVTGDMLMAEQAAAADPTAAHGRWWVRDTAPASPMFTDDADTDHNLITSDIRLLTKTIDIGDWNMDSTSSVSVAHGLTLANIRSVSVAIRNDAGTLTTMLPTTDTTALSNERVEFDATNVIMLRSVSGTFDGTDYDATTYNRGWIIITYTI